MHFMLFVSIINNYIQVYPEQVIFFALCIGMSGNNVNSTAFVCACTFAEFIVYVSTRK